MSAGWTPVSPWKAIPGSGQTLTLTTASTNYAFANKVGLVTGSTTVRAIAISLAPAATAAGATVRINSAATSSTDFFIKTTDPPFILGVCTGDTVNVMPTANTLTAYLTEMTH